MTRELESALLLIINRSAGNKNVANYIQIIPPTKEGLQDCKNLIPNKTSV